MLCRTPFGVQMWWRLHTPCLLGVHLFRMLGVATAKIVYVESIARVYRLSLSGKILYHARLASIFFVQVSDLAEARVGVWVTSRVARSDKLH